MPSDLPNSDPGVISAPIGLLLETVEDVMRRSLSPSERLSISSRLAAINTRPVAPGDLITADLFNAMRADLNNLALRLARLESGQGNAANERAVAALLSNKQALIKGGFQAIINKDPSMVQPGGPGSGAGKTAKCLRDLELYLDAVIDAIRNMKNDELDYVVSQIKETNLALGFSNKWIIDFYLYIKNNLGLEGEPAQLAAVYFDRAISGLS
jgi:phycocyanin alpha chain